jgi:excisionase family DNA binding protein
MTKLLSIREASEQLAVKPATIRAWLLRRKLPRVNCGRSVRIPAEAIERFIERNTVPAQEERIEALVTLRVPEVRRAPGDFEKLPDELSDPSAGWTENPERGRG